jgi:hypothetical protein
MPSTVLGASQNVVLIKRFVSNLIYNLPKSLQRRDFNLPKSLQRRDFNLPKSLQRRDFYILQVPPLEGFREVKVDKRQNEMPPTVLWFS